MVGDQIKFMNNHNKTINWFALIIAASLAKFPVHLIAALFGEFRNSLLDPFDFAYYFVISFACLLWATKSKKPFYVLTGFMILSFLVNGMSVVKDMFKFGFAEMVNANSVFLILLNVAFIPIAYGLYLWLSKIIKPSLESHSVKA